MRAGQRQQQCFLYRQYAFFIYGGGGLSIYESGIDRGSFGTYAASDHLKVAVENGVVKYYRNGTLLYTSTVPPQYPLQVDTSLNTVNSGVYSVVITSTTPSSSGNIQWLVTDQLGTPRLVFDKTSSLTGTKRHDYLPVGEDIFAGTGSRTTAQGYSAADGVRQKFTLYERDNETNLDFAQARYYSSPQGRFTGVDPVMMTEDRLYDPQQINLYAYCRNNPLAFIDPTGETISFNDKDSEKAFNEYEKFINKDPKKYAKEIATLKQLRDSDVNYIPVLGGKQASETAEGNTVPDAAGKNILVRIRNVGGAQGEKLDRNGRFAHELEHARQFDSGELAFGRAQDGTWYPLSYDIYDEVNAYKSIVRVAPPIKDTPLLKSLRDDRDDDNYRRRILTNVYPNLRNRQEPTNQDRAWGAKPGELVRPAANRPFFGRVYDPSRGQKR